MLLHHLQYQATNQKICRFFDSSSHKNMLSNWCSVGTQNSDPSGKPKFQSRRSRNGRLIFSSFPLCWLWNCSPLPSLPFTCYSWIWFLQATVTQDHVSLNLRTIFVIDIFVIMSGFFCYYHDFTKIKKLGLNFAIVNVFIRWTRWADSNRNLIG